MKKLLIGLLIGMCYGSVTAITTVEEGPNNVQVNVTNDITPWFITNTDSIGLALYTTVGSCKVEITSGFTKYCTNNTAVPFDWDGDIVTAGNKKFLSYSSGVSCVRANCSAGTGLFILRKH